MLSTYLVSGAHKNKIRDFSLITESVGKSVTKCNMAVDGYIVAL